MRFGIDRLLTERKLRAPLQGRRVALLAHPASVLHPETIGGLVHSIDALAECDDVKLTAAFGPQHGMRGDKQDNMIESDDFVDPAHGIPVFSLYGEVRRPTQKMLDSFDVILIDLQDVGCRIYTYMTTLIYLLEDCARAGKSVWVLDRPNPAGRPVEGTLLIPGWESFVGGAELAMRHGLTLGEAANWYKAKRKLDVDLNVIAMEGYRPDEGPGFGWPAGEVPWINPSPNAASLNMARCFSGTVFGEATLLSEGRGTTVPLEVVGAPGLDISRILETMQAIAPEWMSGCLIRPCFFEPTFHKHKGQLCNGIQIHTDWPGYQHDAFQPVRLYALFLKALRKVHPGYDLWRQPPYEYEHERLPVDLLNGGPGFREWVDDSGADAADYEKALGTDERQWTEERREFLLY